MLNSVQIKGWASRKRAYLDFYLCPGCGNTQESIIYGANNMAECYRCEKKYPADSFGTAKVRRIVVKCMQCGIDVSLTGSNVSLYGTGWICAGCRNLVAVNYGTQVVNPRLVFEPQWNPTLGERAESVAADLVLLGCETQKDFLVLRLLQVVAKEEESSFLFFHKAEDQKAGIYFDTARRKYLGYIMWDEHGEHAVIHQIFIVPDERRKGLAEQLVRFWVTRYADRINNKVFGIEAPNEKAINLHLKLGHLVREGDSIKGVRCVFAPSM